jgi:predicted HTH domain antitoxin
VEKVKIAVAIPERIRERFLNEILEMYASGEVSAGKAAEMLGVPRAAFYELLAENRISLPERLNRSLLKELRNLRTKKA